MSEPHFKSRISATELRRRLYHMAPGLLPFLLWPIPHSDPISFRMKVIVILLITVLAVFIFRSYRKIARSGEDTNQLGSVAGYAGSVLLTLLFFPAQMEIGVLVLAILAFGDGSATLGGMLIRGPKIPWNHEKSISGLMCFIIVGGLFASVIYWGESGNERAINLHASLGKSLIIGMTVACVAAFVESIPTQINDNIRVGITAACTGALMHWLITGWA